MLRAALFVTVLVLSSFAHPTRPDPSVDSHPRGHVYPESYTFDARDGWGDITVRNSSSSGSPLRRSTSSSGRRCAARSTSNDEGLEPEGASQEVKITYYNGVDLLNPSCWASIGWAPTDESYVCALTISGWSDKPECFDFIELCHDTDCAFVRVVDSCAGCEGQHVDLTEAPFKQIAGALAVGEMMVKMRKAVSSKPNNWDLSLWGPEV